jgi:hypothetical protein
MVELGPMDLVSVETSLWVKLFLSTRICGHL